MFDMRVNSFCGYDTTAIEEEIAKLNGVKREEV